jgi:hypothetical protein
MENKIDNPAIDRLKASTEEAEFKATTAHMRNLEVRNSFYEKLAALGAGSIAVAVSVGIALFGKDESPVGTIHSNLGWLVVIAFFLWVSLICSIIHNYLFVKIVRLEAEKTRIWAGYIGLLNASAMCHLTGSNIGENKVNKIIIDTFDGRIQKDAMNTYRTEILLNRATCLGYIAVSSFLLAYTLVFVCLVRLWFLTR